MIGNPTLVDFSSDATKPVQTRDRSVPIEPGDILLLYTDGVIETFDRARTAFGVKRVESILAGAEDGADATQILDTTFAALAQFRHGAQTDDVLVVAARIL